MPNPAWAYFFFANTHNQQEKKKKKTPQNRTMTDAFPAFRRKNNKISFPFIAAHSAWCCLLSCLVLPGFWLNGNAWPFRLLPCWVLFFNTMRAQYQSAVGKNRYKRNYQKLLLKAGSTEPTRKARETFPFLYHNKPDGQSRPYFGGESVRSATFLCEGWWVNVFPHFFFFVLFPLHSRNIFPTQRLCHVQLTKARRCCCCCCRVASHTPVPTEAQNRQTPKANPNIVFHYFKFFAHRSPSLKQQQQQYCFRPGFMLPKGSVPYSAASV